jgi:hypothetical protein
VCPGFAKRLGRPTRTSRGEMAKVVVDEPRRVPRGIPRVAPFAKTGSHAVSRCLVPRKVRSHEGDLSVSDDGRRYSGPGVRVYRWDNSQEGVRGRGPDRDGEPAVSHL